MAFGIPFSQMILTIASLILFLAVITWFVWRRPRGTRDAAALVFFLAGVGSNVADRLFYNATIDYLIAGRSAWNIADFMIIAGLLSIVIGRPVMKR